jgi:hypothetical protein
MKGLNGLMMAGFLLIGGVLRGMEEDLDTEIQDEGTEMVRVEQCNGYVGIPLKKYQERAQVLQKLIESFQTSSQQLQLACDQNQQIRERLTAYSEQNEEHKNEIFNLQKQLNYLYGIIGIQVCVGLCFVTPKTYFKKVPAWWNKFKQWRSNRNAQSISRKSDASLSKPATSRKVATA